MNGDGHGPLETIWQVGGRTRRRLARLYYFSGAIIGAIALAAIAYAVFGGIDSGGSWVVVGTVSDVRHREVSYDPRFRAFVVASSGELVAFTDADPASFERVFYCPSSGWFQSASGRSQFDHHGFYREGPAGSGLVRIAVRMEHGFVSVNLSLRATGPPSTLTDGSQPVGRYCGGGTDHVDGETGRWVQPIASGEGASG